MVILLAGLACCAVAQQAKSLYQNDFEQTALDKVPDDFLVLDGRFAVKQEGGNKFLELPGAPVDAYGVLFGPTEKVGTAVSARVFGTGQGRRYPTFAVGLNGQGASAYRLQVSPAKKALELFKGDEVKATVPYQWQSGSWTWLRLQVSKVKEGQWKVEGKAWADKEPSAWLVAFDEKEAPVAGRASIWGSPYATTPIRFDDLNVAPAKEVEKLSAGAVNTSEPTANRAGQTDNDSLQTEWAIDTSTVQADARKRILARATLPPRHLGG